MKNLMDRVIDELTDHQAEGDLFFTATKSLKMSAQKGSLSEYKVSSSQILGLRAIKDGRVGISYTEALDDESVSLLIKQALQNAQTSEPNFDETIMDLSGEIRDELKTPEMSVDIEVKIQKTLDLETKPKTMDSRVLAVPHNAYAESEHFSHYLNSRGRSAIYSDKSYSISVSTLMDQEGKKANFHDFDLAHQFNDLNWHKIVENSIYHAKNLLDEKSLPTGKYAVMFNTDCLKQLIGCFSNFYSAKSFLDNMNPWGARIGEEVMTKDLTIEDHPLFENSFRISRFDSEGYERKPLYLIQDGVLTNLYHNSVTAKKFNSNTTGHAWRGPTSALNVCGTDLIIRGKNRKPLPQKYLEIIEMAGLYSGANRVTGSFSVAVKGYMYQNEKRSMTFGNITLSGNLIEIFKGAEVVGDDLLSSTDGSFFSVPIVFEGLSIAGA
jgi:PmbA protein